MKRKSSRKYGGRSKVRRRLFRGRKRRTNRYKRSAVRFISNGRRRFRKGLVHRFTGSDKALTFGTTENSNVYLFNFNTNEFSTANDSSLNGQIAPFITLFDAFKIKRVWFEFWLNDNDEWVKDDQPMVTWSHVYDQDCNGGKFTAESFRKAVVGHRIMVKPGQIYRSTFMPKWAVYNSNNIWQLGFNKWMDIADFEKDNKTMNGVQMFFQGPRQAEANFINYRKVYDIAFASRRCGTTYQA